MTAEWVLTWLELNDNKACRVSEQNHSIFLVRLMPSSVFHGIVSGHWGFGSKMGCVKASSLLLCNRYLFAASQSKQAEIDR